MGCFDKKLTSNKLATVTKTGDDLVVELVQ
jgi:hypothetical protein